MAQATVAPTPSQRAHAAQLVAERDRWLRGRTKADGRSFFVLPGSKGHAHWTAADGSGCTCRGFFYRGTCSHVLAVREYNAIADEEALEELAFAAGSPLAGPVVQTIRPDRYSELFPADQD